MSRPFDHEKLEVYRRSVAFFRSATTIAAATRARDRNLADQLRRAASSITLNIAEGAGEFRRKEKARLYRIALRSATECAGILDLIETMRPAPSALAPARQTLNEIVRMLTRLILNLGEPRSE